MCAVLLSHYFPFRGSKRVNQQYLTSYLSLGAQGLIQHLRKEEGERREEHARSACLTPSSYLQLVQYKTNLLCQKQKQNPDFKWKWIRPITALLLTTTETMYKMWKICSNRGTESLQKPSCIFCSRSFHAIVLSSFNGKGGCCKIGSNSHKETDFYELSHCHNWTIARLLNPFSLSVEQYGVNTLINNLWLGLYCFTAVECSFILSEGTIKSNPSKMLSIQELEKTGGAQSESAEGRRENDGGSSFRAPTQGQEWGERSRVLFPLILRQFQCNHNSVSCQTLLSWPLVVCISKNYISQSEPGHDRNCKTRQKVFKASGLLILFPFWQRYHNFLIFPAFHFMEDFPVWGDNNN